MSREPALDLTVLPTSALPPETRREIIDLCNRAFETDEFNELFDIIADAVDPTHLLCRLDGQLVGHVLRTTRRLWLADGPCLTTAHLDSVAVEPELQGRGLGSLLIERVAAEIAEFDIGTLSTERQSFYTRLGWVSWQGPTARRYETGDVPTPDEPVMVLRTPRTPALDPSSSLVIEARGGNSW